MSQPYSLPAFLQWAVAIATIISSLGIAFAFWQIIVSKQQYAEQLKITSDQFRLQNQGYLKTKFEPHLQTTTIGPNASPNSRTRYQGIVGNILIECGGNLPVKAKVVYCRLLQNGNKIAEADALALAETILYPGENINLTVFGNKFSDEGLLFGDAEALKLSVEYLIHYHDFNDTSIKTVERMVSIHFQETMISTTYLEIKDHFN